MNFLKLSRLFTCSPLSTGTLHLCKIACGSLKFSSWFRLKTLVAQTILSSSSFKEFRNFTVRPRCTTTEFSQFHDTLSFRQKQARCSVIIELSSRKDIAYILSLCKRYGDVKNVIGFTCQQSKFRIITEFSHEESVCNILSDTSLQNVTAGFPFHSRCLYFANKGKQECSADSSGVVTDLSQETKCSGSTELTSVSEMMVELYKKEKISDLSSRLRFLSCVIIQDALKGFFPHCIALPFGSSINGFGRDSSDLDAVIRLFPEQGIKNSELFFHVNHVNERERDLHRRAIFTLEKIFLAFMPGVTDVSRVLNARVPILKYNHQHLMDLKCDISVNNMTGFYMSEILFLCSELDPRVRPLVYTVRKWAKESNITFERPGTWITNFSLILLVIFFLQSRPVPILPPLHRLIEVPSHDTYETRAVGYVTERGSRDIKPTGTEQNNESLSILLQEFFQFIAGFPFKEKRISLMGGDAGANENGYPLCIDYPLDEAANVSKNVSLAELQHLCRAAFGAAKNLEKNSNSGFTDLMSVLGASGLKQDANKIDIRVFFDEPCDKKKSVSSVR